MATVFEKPQVAPVTVPATAVAARRPSRLANIIWLVAKNVTGVILILGSWAAGLTLPVPIGMPMFFIGFALITFPGKRRLTAYLLRGQRISLTSRTFRRIMAVSALLVPAGVLVYIALSFHLSYAATPHEQILFGVLYAAGAVFIWCFRRPLAIGLNRLLAGVPQLRRRMRPWMRRRGIDLLPPRRRRRARPGGQFTRAPDQEILEFHSRHHRRARIAWTSLQPWIRRSVGVLVTVAIFVWVLKPVYWRWHQVRGRISQTDWRTVLLASAMFAIYLFLFRAFAWHRILSGFGHRLPRAAAVRIWSTSELARYLPGLIWQVVGRVYLIRPYGVSGSVCSASQVLEIILFLLANILVAVGCLAWFGIRQLHDVARGWFLFVLALVPVLLVLIHPQVFYGLLGKVMARLGKPPVAKRLRYRELNLLLAWSLLGLMWESLAIWLIIHDTLGLAPAKWWVVAGAYCLAWCAGFLAFWSPGGLGVRELVFVAAMDVALPEPVRRHFGDPKELLGFLAFLSVLLRLWATAGELMLAGTAYVIDLKGALGRPDAPGRVVPGPASDAHLSD